VPELPEVETTRRGIEPHLVGRSIERVHVHNGRLRWPVPALQELLPGATIESVGRRAKYLLVHCDRGTLIIHLGMSGSLRLVAPQTPLRKHDHVELCFADQCLRLHDPRRFGAMLWTEGNPASHPLLCRLGPEPLSADFDGDVLVEAARGSRVAIKNLIMNAQVVVGVGNIYATEALFQAGIHPARASGRVSAQRLALLADAIREILAYAIDRGGTTLRDFLNESGNPGYFAQELMIYGRAGEGCKVCGRTIRTRQIGQRASAYCPGCQH
jgi:formamidopyrimidine-DNA glycosylase